MNWKKGLAAVLILVMTVSVSACRKEETPTGTESVPLSDFVEGTAGSNESNQGESVGTGGSAGQGQTMIVGSSVLGGVFSPFYYANEADRQLLELIFETPGAINSSNELTDRAGHVEEETVTSDSGSVQTKYTVKLQPDMTFSDGEPVTIDDYLFTLYVLSDPFYDGSLENLRGLGIAGLDSYYYDNEDPGAAAANLQKNIDRAVKDITDDGLKQWMKDSRLAGWWDGSMPGNADGRGMTWTDYMAGLGADLNGLDAGNPDAVFEKLVECEFTYYRDDYYKRYVKEITKNKTVEYMQATLAEGAEVTEISGIERVDDYTCTIVTDGYHAGALRRLALLPIVPSHYYGDGAVVKGNLETVQARNSEPMGMGPYVFQGYENYVVTMTANSGYYRGVPKASELKVQELNENQKLEAVLSGAVDITQLTATPEAFSRCEGAGVSYQLSDDTGFQYIGINAERVSSQDVRKGLLSLVDREAAVSSYYGGLADIVERPMSPAAPEYPAGAGSYYSYDIEQAKAFFKEAGYTSKGGQLSHKKDGQLTVNIGVVRPVENPMMQLVNQLKSALESLGAACNIIEYQYDIMWDKADRETLDLWVGTMEGLTDSNLSRAYDISDNHFGLKDEKLKSAIEEGIGLSDLEQRRAKVAETLDLLMQKAVVLPVCQTVNMMVYNTDMLKAETLPGQISPYEGYEAGIYGIEMK